MPRFHERRLEGDYDSEAAHLLALNHRESASYRWRYLWRPILAPDASDFPTDVLFWGRSVNLCRRPPANVLLTIWAWRDSYSAWLDLWVEPELSADGSYVSDLLAVAGRQALSMGASSLEVVVRESLCRGIEETFEAVHMPLERGDPWLVKSLG